jgi:hypothetical protein
MSSPQFIAAYDQEMMRTAENIRIKGVSIVAVDSDADCACCPPSNRATRRSRGRRNEGMFAYTIGLFGLAHPELLMFPESSDQALYVLNFVSARVLGGGRLLPGEVVGLHDIGRHAIVQNVANPGEIAFRANDYYQRPPEASVPLLLLTLTDTEGRLPADVGYSGRPQPTSFRP